MRLARVLLCGVVFVAACKERRSQSPAPSSVNDAEPVSKSAEAKADAVTRERVVLDSVAILAEDIEPPAEIFADEMGKNLGHALVTSGLFFPDMASVGPGLVGRQARLDVKVSHGVVPDAADGPVALASAEARLVWLEGPPSLLVRENILVQRALGTQLKVPPGEVAAHVARAVHALVEGLTAKERLLRAPDAEVLRMLLTSDPNLEVWALEVIAERKIMKARDAVASRINSNTREVADAAVSAMVALADPKSVGLLTRRANFSDYQNLRTIMEATTAIGGPDAVDFLEFVASGHPDPSIVEQANDSLARLKKTSAKAP